MKRYNIGDEVIVEFMGTVESIDRKGYVISEKGEPGERTTAFFVKDKHLRELELPKEEICEN